jgi:hypothetical protein
MDAAALLKVLMDYVGGDANDGAARTGLAG